MDYFPSKTNNRLNREPFQPDLITGRAMLNPIYPVTVDPDCKVYIDSGGFQSRDRRLLLWDALQRQLGYEQRLSWQITGTPDWYAAGLVTYDRVIGLRLTTPETRAAIKADARPAVVDTLAGAAYYASQRERIRGKIIFACQGATPRQYAACARAMLRLMRPGDIFGFGGCAPIGKVPSLKASFYETLALVLPMLRRAGIDRAHLLGVTVSDATRQAAAMGRAHDISLSNDSRTAETAGVMGNAWSDATQSFRSVYTRAQKYIDYHPAALAHANIAAYNDWSAQL